LEIQLDIESWLEFYPKASSYMVSMAMAKYLCYGKIADQGKAIAELVLLI
jgi:hypothetical protein